MLSVSVMAHGKRRAQALELQEALAGAEIAWDQRNDRWDTGSRAWQAYDRNADWHLVVQDDAVLCKDFLPGVAEALTHVTAERPVSFYVGKQRPFGQQVAKAVATAGKKRWLGMRGPLWGVAIALPTTVIDSMLASCAESNVSNYDLRIADYFMDRSIRCWYSLPSLVNHRVGPEHPSLVHGRGSNNGRVAHAWIGDRSPLDITWSNNFYSFGDPSRPWTDRNGTYVCEYCEHSTTDLATAVRHAVQAHKLDPPDMLASTSHHVNALISLRDALTPRCYGTFWAVGKQVAQHVGARQMVVVPRADATRRIGGRPGPFTICGAARDFKYLAGRPAWSLDGFSN